MKKARNQYAIRVLEREIGKRKDKLLDLDERKEETFGSEQVELARRNIRGQIEELGKAIEILEITWKS